VRAVRVDGEEVFEGCAKGIGGEARMNVGYGRGRGAMLDLPAVPGDGWLVVVWVPSEWFDERRR